MMRRKDDGWTMRRTHIGEVLETLKGNKYDEEISYLRQMLPLMNLTVDKAGAINNPELNRISRVCFSAEWDRRGGVERLLGYNAMVLLEVNNLRDLEEAEAVRSGAGRMPQTLLAFVGVNGRSVKIVCRGEPYPDSTTTTPKVWDVGQREQIEHFHTNLYEQARLAYNAQLGVTVEKLEPRLDRACYMSHDAQMVYNAHALPFYVDTEPRPQLPMAEAVGRPSASTDYDSDLLAPGRNEDDTWGLVYEYNLQKACEETFDEMGSKDRPHHTLSLLAQYCLETGVPLAYASSMATYSWVGKDRELVVAVFNRVYNDKVMRQYREQKRIVKPLKYMAPEAVLTMKIDLFLRQHYDMRMNVMRGVAEFRERDGFGFDFRDLTDEARNSITMRALRQGIRCWDKDIRRFVNSEDIRPYDPIADYLERLPRWDGRDRVTPLANRVKTQYEEWPQLFHIWMRSMVAMWQGKGQLTGNALVPLLIGRQGCGKSSFCRILLPRQLRDYFNDRINFKNEADLNLGLTSFALINLDEFDKITGRQQVVLKYLVSTADLKYRPPYGKAYSAHRRYASFIGTTNEMTPLTDPSGSRRFVCVLVEGDIDFQTPIEYPQLFAQLKQEIENGERYWLDDGQTQRLMQHNRAFQRISGLAEMVGAVIERPDKPYDDSAYANGTPQNGQWMTLTELSDLLRQRFGSDFRQDKGTLERLGHLLKRPEYRFDCRRRNHGRLYWVKVKE